MCRFFGRLEMIADRRIAITVRARAAIECFASVIMANTCVHNATGDEGDLAFWNPRPLGDANWGDGGWRRRGRPALHPRCSV
jgi:hypothetical protein